MGVDEVSEGCKHLVYGPLSGPKHESQQEVTETYE